MAHLSLERKQTRQGYRHNLTSPRMFAIADIHGTWRIPKPRHKCPSFLVFALFSKLLFRRSSPFVPPPIATGQAKLHHFQQSGAPVSFGLHALWRLELPVWSVDGRANMKWYAGGGAAYWERVREGYIRTHSPYSIQGGWVVSTKERRLSLTVLCYPSSLSEIVVICGCRQGE